MRRNAPEVLLTGQNRRCAPEEPLGSLVQAEIAAHEAASTQPALKAAFPVAKTLESSHVAASSIRPAILDYLPSLEGRGNRKGVVEKVNHAS